MLTINSSNINQIRRMCGLEMACRAIPNITLDLDHSIITDLVMGGEISKESALASAPTMTPDVLGPISSLSLLERYASLNNPHYALEWYACRDQWSKLLYTKHNNPDVLSKVLRSLPQTVIERLEFSIPRYLSARVPYLDLVALSKVTDDGVYPQPNLEVSDPVLTMWRALLQQKHLKGLYDSTKWDIFNILSNDCIYINSSTAETQIMVTANNRPLPVILSRGHWTRSNIAQAFRLIEMSTDAESMMLILFERICRLWGPQSVIASDVKSRLRYVRILTPDKLLKHYTVEWFPSVPAIHHYLLEATDLELERLIENNYSQGVGIYDAVGVTTPSSLRRLCIVALRWLLVNKPSSAKTMRNILNIIAHNTHGVPWDKEGARVCQDALDYTYTKELKIQFVLMETYPLKYKEILSK